MNPLFSYHVYVAAPMGRSDVAYNVAQKLRSVGQLDVCSTWHDQQGEDQLLRNLVELAAADVLVALTYEDAERETYVEIGRALAKPIPVVWWPQNRADGRGACLSLSQSRLVIEVSGETEAVTLLRKLRREKIASRLGDGAFEVG